ncbi:hypothetical protein TCAL_16239 [Tigriopus californicus]|uniref:Uncharacterized protein n=1 Tax=Tigriopus californicus TaxID=6832 RepID=A0A553P501_TIGCA|nr:hypothetical protein TCAL_16239 [Tigriopus californicus]
MACSANDLAPFSTACARDEDAKAPIYTRHGSSPYPLKARSRLEKKLLATERPEMTPHSGIPLFVDRRK